MRRTASFALLALLAFGAPPAHASWLNPGPSDAELEMVVRAAYTAATRYAAANGNYFARDGESAPLRDAIASAMAAQNLEITVPDLVSSDADATRICAPVGAPQLRLAVNLFGDGVSLAAASDTRVFAYHYDPHELADIVVLPGKPCGKP